jgi:hypothetical protein
LGVIGATNLAILEAAKLYLSGPSVESMRHANAGRSNFVPENDGDCSRDDDGGKEDCGRYVHPANMRPDSTLFQPSRLPQSN